MSEVENVQRDAIAELAENGLEISRQRTHGRDWSARSELGVITEQSATLRRLPFTVRLMPEAVNQLLRALEMPTSSIISNLYGSAEPDAVTVERCDWGATDAQLVGFAVAGSTSPTLYLPQPQRLLVALSCVEESAVQLSVSARTPDAQYRVGTVVLPLTPLQSPIDIVLRPTMIPGPVLPHRTSLWPRKASWASGAAAFGMLYLANHSSRPAYQRMGPAQSTAPVIEQAAPKPPVIPRVLPPQPKAQPAREAKRTVQQRPKAPVPVAAKSTPPKLSVPAQTAKGMPEPTLPPPPAISTGQAVAMPDALRLPAPQIIEQPKAQQQDILAFYQPPIPTKQVSPSIGSLPPQFSPQSGMLRVLVTVDATGHVSDAKPMFDGRPLNPTLLGLVIAAAREWQFRPATLRGKPVSSQHSIVFRFGAKR